MAKFKVGDVVKVVKNTCSHGYKIGEKYKVATSYTSSTSHNTWILASIETGAKGTCYITEDNMEPVYGTRAEMAAYLESEVLPGKKAALEALKKEVEDLESKIERYKKFESAEHEAAHLISQIFKTGGDEGAILDVLKTTKVLSGKEDF